MEKITDVIMAFCGAIIKIAVAVMIVIVLYRGSQKAYDYGYRIFEEPPVSSGEGYTITVNIQNLKTIFCRENTILVLL